MKLDEELKKALQNHDDWAKLTFGGVWKGLIYGLIVVGSVHAYSMAPLLITPWMLVAAAFYVITKYDSTVVSLWNEREMQRVTSQYIMDNMDKLEPGSYSIDIPNDLDGTNGDE